MQSEGSIKQKLKQVRFRHLKRLIELNLAPRPCNCEFNESVGSPSGEPLGICMNPVGKFADLYQICDENLKLDLSGSCGMFSPRKSKEEIKKDFVNFLEAATMDEIGASYPVLAALMWVLSDPQAGSAPPVAESEQRAPVSLPVPPPRPEARKRSWWQRLWGGWGG